MPLPLPVLAEAANPADRIADIAEVNLATRRRNGQALARRQGQIRPRRLGDRAIGGNQRQVAAKAAAGVDGDAAAADRRQAIDIGITARDAADRHRAGGHELEAGRCHYPRQRNQPAAGRCRQQVRGPIHHAATAHRQGRGGIDLPAAGAVPVAAEVDDRAAAGNVRAATDDRQTLARGQGVAIGGLAIGMVVIGSAAEIDRDDSAAAAAKTRRQSLVVIAALGHDCQIADTIQAGAAVGQRLTLAIQRQGPVKAVGAGQGNPDPLDIVERGGRTRDQTIHRHRAAIGHANPSVAARRIVGHGEACRAIAGDAAYGRAGRPAQGGGKITRSQTAEIHRAGGRTVVLDQEETPAAQNKWCRCCRWSRQSR